MRDAINNLTDVQYNGLHFMISNSTPTYILNYDLSVIFLILLFATPFVVIKGFHCIRFCNAKCYEYRRKRRISVANAILVRNQEQNIGRDMVRDIGLDMDISNNNSRLERLLDNERGYGSGPGTGHVLGPPIQIIEMPGDNNFGANNFGANNNNNQGDYYDTDDTGEYDEDGNEVPSYSDVFNYQQTND
jgi:hypothetical protein